MTVYVALLRGVNVGGNHILPMQELRSILEQLGCEFVRTYIQSGNAVFRSDADKLSLAKNIGAAIAQQFGFEAGVQLLSADELRSAMAANPYPKAVDTPNLLSLWFLARPATDPDLTKLAELKSANEHYELHSQTFYLHAPDGIGRSRLASKIERCLGVETTARNWRTVNKIAALAADVEGDAGRGSSCA
jgi:uncharacterized protein (DUF1697 family)